jgi:hypothetical protein
MMTAFPAEFAAAKEELSRFCAAQGSRASLLQLGREVVHAEENLPKSLLPFMVIEEPSWPDVYAFDFSSSPPAVVVWSDHAIVERWDSFDAFLRWTRESTSGQR